MSLVKLTKDTYMPPHPDTAEWEYYEDMAANLYLLTTSNIYNGLGSYRYPWLLHLRESLGYMHLDCLKRVKVFRQ